jgi:hypothetical protein
VKNEELGRKSALILFKILVSLKLSVFEID